MSEIQNKTETPKTPEINNNPDKINQLIDEIGLNNHRQELLNFYNSLDNFDKQKLIKEIEDNNDLKFNSDLILDIIKSYGKKEKKEEKKEKNEENSKKKDEIKENNNENKEKKSKEEKESTKETKKQADQRLDDFYKNTGFKDKTEFLKSNPELEKLYNHEKQAKKIEEGSYEDTRVLLGVILNNRSNIKSSTGEKLDDKIFDELKDSALKLRVEYRDKFPCGFGGKTENTKEMIREGGFSGADFKGDVMVKGDKIFYEDNSGVRQTWNTGEVPPVKYLEQDGIKIESKVRCESKYGYMVQIENLGNEINNLENSITDKQQTIKGYFRQFKIGDNGFEGSMTFGEQYSLLISTLEDRINKEEKEGANSEDINFLKNKKAEIEKIASEIRADFDSYKAKKEELKKLLQAQANRVPDYRKSMLESDENIKYNLTYLKSLHLDIFGKNTDEFIALINQHKGSLGYPGVKDIDLSNKLTREDKNLIIKAMIRILGEGSELLFNTVESRMFDNNDTTSEKIKDRLVKTGSIGENRMDININNIKGILEKGK